METGYFVVSKNQGKFRNRHAKWSGLLFVIVDQAILLKFDWSKANQNKFAKGTRPVTIRMDVEVIQWLMAESKKLEMRGYQTLVNELLRFAMSEAKGSRQSRRNELRKEIRQAVRQELKKRA